MALDSLPDYVRGPNSFDSCLHEMSDGDLDELLSDVLARHLEPDDIVVVMTISQYKLRHLYRRQPK